MRERSSAYSRQKFPGSIATCFKFYNGDYLKPIKFLTYNRETTCRYGLWNRAGTIVSLSLVIGQLNNNFASKPERIVEIEVTPGSCWFAIDGDILDIRGCAEWDRFLHGFGVVVLDDDRGTGIHVAIMNGVLRNERR